MEQVESAGPSAVPASTLLNVGHHDSGISMGSPISSVQSVDRNRIPSTSHLDLEPASPSQDPSYHLATSSPNPPDGMKLPAAPQSELAESVKTENISEIWNPQNSNPSQEQLLLITNRLEKVNFYELLKDHNIRASASYAATESLLQFRRSLTNSPRCPLRTQL